MPVAPTKPFPLCIEDPSTRHAGSVYVADLAEDGPHIGRRPFERAVCTLAAECVDGTLTSIQIPDYRTVFVSTTDGTRTQLELVYVDDSLDEPHLEALYESRRVDVDRLAVATVGQLTINAQAFCLGKEISVIEMDSFSAESGPWTRSV